MLLDMLLYLFEKSHVDQIGLNLTFSTLPQTLLSIEDAHGGTGEV